LKSLWDDDIAKEFKTDLDIRVYTSRLLGQDDSLILHGGGNASVKSEAVNVFGEKEEILYVTGNGHDMSTIKAEEFSPVKREILLKIAQLKELSDVEMVKNQRVAMIDPYAPTPSLSAILHALIPFKFVEHVHADDILTITNTPDAIQKIEDIYGDKVLIVPYEMPGFSLVKLFYEISKDINWDELDGIILLNHGFFAFDNDAKKSYEKVIDIVTKAQEYLQENGAVLEIEHQESTIDIVDIAKIRKEVCRLKGHACIALLNESDEALYFSKTALVKAPRESLLDNQYFEIPQIGPLTSEHAVITKRTPAVLNKNFEDELLKYVKDYEKYFDKYKNANEICLNTAPNFAVIKDRGILSFATSLKEAKRIRDINNHTIKAMLKAQKIGGYKPLDAKNIFDVEYGELERIKIKKVKNVSQYKAKVAVITRYANDAGLKCAKILNNNGAIVVSLDISNDLDSQMDMQNTIEKIIKNYGGIDIVVEGTEVYTSAYLPEFDKDNKFLNMLVPFLKQGIPTNVSELICAINQPLL